LEIGCRVKGAEVAFGASFPFVPASDVAEASNEEEIKELWLTETSQGLALLINCLLFMQRIG
jgi:hypothetical protein